MPAVQLTYSTLTQSINIVRRRDRCGSIRFGVGGCSKLAQTGQTINAAKEGVCLRMGLPEAQRELSKTCELRHEFGHFGLSTTLITTE